MSSASNMSKAHFNPLDNELNRIKGLCYCQGMEKEASLRLDPLAAIRVKLPQLKTKAQFFYCLLKKGVEEANRAYGKIKNFDKNHFPLL